MKVTDEVSMTGRRSVVQDADDLVVCLAFVVLADLLLVVLPSGWVAVRTLVGLPLLFFVPGYALVAALYPRRELHDDSREPALDRVERAAYSFGLSVAVLPVLAFVHSAVPWVGFSLLEVVGSVTVVTLLGLLGGVVRRSQVDESKRYRSRLREWPGTFVAAVGTGNSREVAVNVALLLAVTGALVVVGYSMIVPVSGEAYTNFALLTESEDGALVDDGYPTEFTAGEGEELVVSVGNHEGRAVEYTVVVAVQRVQGPDAGSEVVEQRELQRLGTTLGAGERWRQPHTVAPERTGEDLRLAYFLYRGDAPADPSSETAYRKLHLWISVTDSGG